MNKQHKKPEQPDTPPADQEPQEKLHDPPASEEQDNTGQAADIDLAEEMAVLNEKLLRAAADYQNLARRSELNVQAAREQALMDVARSLVSVLDHLDRALGVDPKATPASAIVDGVTMVRDELLRSLKQFGIERVEAEPGEDFDPNRHQAMMRQASDDFESNKVVQQFHPGYMLKNKTVRPAAVSVAE